MSDLESKKYEMPKFLEDTLKKHSWTINTESIDVLKEDALGCNIDGVLHGMTKADIEHLKNVTEALTREEAIVVLNYLPIDLIFARVGAELEKNRRFANAVTKAMSIISEE